jgi:hypothetical protein
MNIHPIQINKVPSRQDLKRLQYEVEECILLYQDGNNTLLYDHLENAIAKVLGYETVPNPELEE